MKNLIYTFLVIASFGACVMHKPMGVIEPKHTSAAELSAGIKDTSKGATPKKGLQWLDVESAFVKAQKENKIMMVDVYTDWCGWCKVMDRKTFSNDTIQEYLNKYFVVAKMNPEKNHTYILGKDTFSATDLHAWLGYGKSFGYPTTYFVVKPGKTEERYASVGFNESWDFKNILVQVKSKVNP